MQNLKELRYDQSPSAPFVWLMDSLMAAVEVCVKQDPSLLKAYLGMVRGNTLSRTWEKGLAKKHKVQHKMDRLAKDTTRFLQALNLVSHPNTPIHAIARTVGKFKNNVEDLH